MTHNIKRHSLQLNRLEHWVWAIPVLLMVWMLAVRQIDLYPPTPDEFFSLHNAGGLVDTPYSPIEILQSIQQNSPQHTIGYFLLLSVWGNVISWDIAITRVLTICFGLLSLTMMVRLAWDVIHPIAGIYMIVIASGTAFYAFYLPHTRMYPIIVFLATVTMWLYIRIVFKLRQPQPRDYMALFVAVFALVNTHVFSSIFLIMLGLYHLIFVRRSKKWYRVIYAVCLAVMLFLPYIGVIVTGMEVAVGSRVTTAISSAQAIQVWLTIMFNNSLPLLIITIIGIVIAHRYLTFERGYHIAPGVLYVIIIGLGSVFPTVITQSGMRYLLGGWSPFLLLMVSGWFGLYLWRKWTIILLPIWLIAGLFFNTGAHWEDFIAGRVDAFRNIPIHAVSRFARDSNKFPVMIFRENISHLDLNRRGISQRTYYLEPYTKDINVIPEIDDWNRLIDDLITNEPVIWLVYRPSNTSSAGIETMNDMMDREHQLCDKKIVGVETIVEQYQWIDQTC